MLGSGVDLASEVGSEQGNQVVHGFRTFCSLFILLRLVVADLLSFNCSSFNCFKFQSASSSIHVPSLFFFY